MESKIVDVYLYAEFDKKSQICKYAYIIRDYDGNMIDRSLKISSKNSETAELKDTLSYMMGINDIVDYAIENDIKFIKLTSNFEGLERMLTSSTNNSLPPLKYFRDMYQDSIDRGINIIFNEIPEKDGRAKTLGISPDMKRLMKVVKNYNPDDPEPTQSS